MILNDIGHTLEALSALPSLYYPSALILGLLVGSFLNVVILRTPKMMEQEFRQECCDFLDVTLKGKGAKHEARVTLSHPASTCPHCHTPIKPWHNIPVISYVLLRGRCAYCGAGIGSRYPLIELASGVLSVLTIALLGLTIPGLVALLLLWALIALTMIDIDTQLLPDSITLPLLW